MPSATTLRTLSACCVSGAAFAFAVLACDSVIDLGPRPTRQMTVADGSAPRCGPPPHPKAECNACVEDACCDLGIECAKDPRCLEATQCALDCVFDGPCVDACGDAAPPAYAPYIGCASRCAAACVPSLECIQIIDCCRSVTVTPARNLCNQAVNAGDATKCGEAKRLMQASGFCSADAG